MSGPDRVLITGGAGFIGSHCAIEFLQNGFEVAVVDNLSNAVTDENGYPVSLQRIQDLTGKSIHFKELDIRDEVALGEFFSNNDIDCVVHCAALKKNAESLSVPLEFYDINVTGTLNLLKAMQQHGVRKFLFSGSCTVYGLTEELPIRESHPVGVNCTTPYGWSKFMVEVMLKDFCRAAPEFFATSLRYFNPVGSHPSGKVGEDPRGVPNNLAPFMAKVATGKLQELVVYGTDYETADGTAVRDYIHVVDVARGHVKAIQKFSHSAPGFKAYNLGLGRGHSVLEVWKAFSQACGKEIPYSMNDRRPGDAPEVYCDASLAERELGWAPEYDIDDMCRDLWNFYVNNPNGYRKEGEELETE